MARRRRKGGGMFWLGAGLGLLLSAAAVAIAAEFTYARRRRLLATGMLDVSEDALVQDFSEAIQAGLEDIGKAAAQLGHTFADARRELVRFGLDPATGGGGDAGWYYEEDQAASGDGARPAPDYERDWDAEEKPS